MGLALGFDLPKGRLHSFTFPAIHANFFYLAFGLLLIFFFSAEFFITILLSRLANLEVMIVPTYKIVCSYI